MQDGKTFLQLLHVTVHGSVCDEDISWGWMPFTYGIPVKEVTSLGYFLSSFYFCILTQAMLAGCCWESSLKELHMVLTLTCVVLSILCTLSCHLSLKLLQVWSKMEKGAELMWKTGHCNQPLNSAREEKPEPPQGSSIQCVSKLLQTVYTWNIFIKCAVKIVLQFFISLIKY